MESYRVSALSNQGMNANFTHIQKLVSVWVLNITDKTIYTLNQERWRIFSI